jgi:hypothetical protein
MKILATPLSVSVHYEHLHPVYGEGVTVVSVGDEAAGEFITLTQNDDCTLKFDLEELEAVLKAARSLMASAGAARKLAETAR